MNTDDTAPVYVQEEPVKKPKPRRWRWVLLGILMLLVLGALGGYLGYQNGISQRLAKQSSQVAMEATTQFQLGLEDQKAGRMEMARKRFEYVLKLDPKYPNAAAKLTEVMVAMATVATPTPQPTPTVEPTKDSRGEEDLFNQAAAFLKAGDWQTTITTLDTLRTRDLTYRAVEVDGMYYMALRNLGVDNITKKGNLEGGMYNLALSERFAPLDKEADGFRSWVRMYQTGASYWGLDWKQVIDYFAQVYPTFPNMRDSSGWTATDRYRIANVRYADQLAAAEDWCTAEQYYNNALAMSLDPAVIPTATAIHKLCSPATATPQPQEPTVEPLPTDMSGPLPTVPATEPTLPTVPTDPVETLPTP